MPCEHKDSSTPRVGAGAPSTTRVSRRAPSLTTGKKVVFSACATLLGLTLIETLLWLGGVRPYRDSHDPLLDFAPGPPLFTRAENEYRTTEARLTYFNPQSFAVRKPVNGVRVFCLGESTTFGHPYDDATSYVGWLRELLREIDAEHTWEMVNCGGVSYASYRLAHLMDELVSYEPDVFIIYVGQNEFLEDRTYGTLQDRNELWNLAAEGASRFRTTTLIDSLLHGAERGRHREAVELMPSEVDTILDHTAGPTTYTRDSGRRQQILAHFRFNLARICRIARSAGAQVMLIKPASNLRDFSPFRSEYGTTEFSTQLQIDLQLGRGEERLTAGDAAGALPFLERALAADPQYARAAYLAGVAAFQAKEFEKAEKYFQMACDEDICPLRATSEILQAVDDVGRAEQVPVIDFPAFVGRVSRQMTGCSSPGAECFLDHVHPTIEMHLELATELVRALADSGMLRMEDRLPSAVEAVRLRITATINETRHALALSNLSQVLSWAGLTDEPLRLALQAADKAPENVEVLAQLGRMYDKTGQLPLSRQIYERALQIEPANPLVLYRLGRTWMIEGDYQRAANLLESALENTPERAPRAHRMRLLESLGKCYEQLGRSEQAEVMFRRAQEQ